MDTYNRIVLIVQSCQKKLPEAIAVALMEQYEYLGDERIVHVIERWASRPTFSIDKLCDMLAGKADLVFTQDKDKPKKQDPLPFNLQSPPKDDGPIATNEETRAAFSGLLKKMG